MLPFAIALSRLSLGESDFFRRTEMIFMQFAWLFLGLAIILGGVWPYEALGWGGYWAWDPVETASLLP